MSTDNSGPAFPFYENSFGVTSGCEGMTLRDYFAANAPIGVADANEAFYRHNSRNAGMSEMMAMLVYMRGVYADAMIAERSK